MPTTTEAHRASIGLFYPVLVQIFNRKRRNSDPNRRHSQKCSTEKELTNWFVCMTLSTITMHNVLLLTQCMDVEKNPGPGPDHTYTSMLQNMQAAMEWRFSELIGNLQSYTAGISQKMDDNFGRLDRTLGQLLEDVVGLKTAVQQDKEDIRELQEDRDNVTHRLDRIEKELDSLERLSKHCNLKFLGVTEGLRENYRTSIERIVDILNECSSSRTWNKSDIETAHRIGDRRQRSDQPRPLIVTFHRWSDKWRF